MDLGILKQINWVDIFALIILIRTSYIATRNTLPIELFKLLGTAAAVYLSLHYYIAFSSFLKDNFGINIPFKFLEFSSFLILAMLGYVIFFLARWLFYRFLKIEAVPDLERWGALILSIARGILLAGFVLFILVFTNLNYFKNSVRDSYSGKILIEVPVVTYSSLWDGVMSKFFTTEKFNKSVLEVQETLSHK